MSKAKKDDLATIKKKTEEFHKYIKKNYPHKDISEYTRLNDQLETFLAYGVWENYDEE